MKNEPDVHVVLVKGGLGEFSVSIEDRKCIEEMRFWYPRPSRIVATVRAILAEKRNRRVQDA